MARTFLFLFVFTVPFVMVSDKSSDLAHCFVVFLLTYGFVGLEMVAIELDSTSFGGSSALSNMLPHFFFPICDVFR